MCTVTIIPVGTASQCVRDAESAARGTGVRLACNRDELRTRPAALPPVIRKFGNRKTIMPVDPVSNGTWIAVNDAGIAATLLNVNLDSKPATSDHPATSRGMIIPRLMASETLDQAIELTDALDPRHYAPFRLVIVDHEQLGNFYSDGRTLRIEHSLIGNCPRLFTSSGLGDTLVEGPRRDLFNDMFSLNADYTSQQDAFHRHAWSDRRHLSVCMERSEARTVSHTVIEIEPAQVTLVYVPDAPGRAHPLAPITLARSRAV